MNSQAALDSSPADAVPSTLVDHLPARWKPYARLARLDRPIGTWLLYWPCVMGLILGAAADERRFLDWRDLWYVVLFGIGALVMRGAGCTFNDIVDRDIDDKVARTRARPIPSGAVGVKQAAVFLVVLCLIGLTILLQLNWFAVALGAASANGAASRLSSQKYSRRSLGQSASSRSSGTAAATRGTLRRPDCSAASIALAPMRSILTRLTMVRRVNTGKSARTPSSAAFCTR